MKAEQDAENAEEKADKAEEAATKAEEKAEGKVDAASTAKGQEAPPVVEEKAQKGPDEEDAAQDTWTVQGTRIDAEDLAAGQDDGTDFDVEENALPSCVTGAYRLVGDIGNRMIPDAA